jgi:2-dehydropantoate 2-reductase
MNQASPLRILVIGAGAVGGYFAARLAAAGRDVTILVRPARAAQLRSIGLQVFSPHGDVTVQPKLLLASELKETFDLILLSTKAYSLAAAMDDFAPTVGPDTAIVPLLNGMAHLQALTARFGEQAVLGGASRIVADLDAEGRVHQFGPLHDIVFGERTREVTPRIQAIDATLRDCGFPTMLSPDILASMWMKWMLLSSLAGTTCLLRASVGQIEAMKYGRETVYAIVDESASVAAANGYPQDAKFIESHKARMTEPGSALTASMFRDLTKGQPVESEQILGDFLARGAGCGVATPLLMAAYVQLSVYADSLLRA